MRPVHQLFAAVVVVAASVAAAFATIQDTACSLGPNASVKFVHKWSATGQGGGTCTYEVLGGTIYYGDDLACSMGLRRLAPVMGNVTFAVPFQIPSKRITRSVWIGIVNTQSAKTNETVAAQLTGQVGALLQNLVKQEQEAAETFSGTRRRPFVPLPSNFSIDKVVASGHARLNRKQTESSGTVVFKYFGMLPEPGARRPPKVRGKITLQYRRAPQFD